MSSLQQFDSNWSVGQFLVENCICLGMTHLEVFAHH